MNALRTTLPVEIRSVDPSTPDTQHSATLDFISSDETLDRYSEIISASGWKLDTYRKNPVFQNAHQYGDIIYTLGRAEITEVRSFPLPSDGRGIKGEGSSRSVLFQRIQFAVNANPMAKVAHALYAGKFLNAVSVGFLPLKWEDGSGSRSISADDYPLPSDGRGVGGEGPLAQSPNFELRSPQFRRRYLEQELLEVSAVAIPANPNALALAYKSGALEKSDLNELAALLKYTLEPREAYGLRRIPALSNSLSGSTLDAPRSTLFRLALQLRDLLKHT